MGKKYTKYTEEEWDDIKEYYLSDERISYDDIKEKYSVSITAISKRFKGLKPITKKAHGKGKRHKTYVTTENYTSKNGDRIYEWQCEVCGTIKNTRVSNMNKIQSCECQKIKKPIDEEALREKERRREVRKKKKELQNEIDRLNQEIRDIREEQKRDLIGTTWNRLTILEHIEDSKCLCRCECGNETTPKLYNVINETTRSCGCLHTEHLRTMSENNKTHGMTKSSVYQTWRAMRRRCNDPNFLRYEHYGGRGIIVCEEWDNSFEAFYEYMGDRPEGMTIDRIDVNGNYEPGNVRWADPKTQTRNQRRFKDKEWGD
jgi:DNA-binding transcriptional regulator GbsR (MarR family)